MQERFVTAHLAMSVSTTLQGFTRILQTLQMRKDTFEVVASCETCVVMSFCGLFHNTNVFLEI